MKISKLLLGLATMLVFQLTACSQATKKKEQTQKEQKEEKTQPNVIFILVDDMGWADLGVYGSKEIKTPNIDKLAANGMRFSDAYAGHTVCAPSRCVLMTGKNTGNSRVRSNSGTSPLFSEDVTVAEVFKSKGYTTGGFGKWGLGTMQSSGAAERQGFDTFFGYYDQVHAHTYYPSYLVKDGAPFVLPGNAKNNGYEHGVTPVSTKAERSKLYRNDKMKSPKRGGVSTTIATGEKREFSQYVIFEETLKFIKDNKDKPFFCYAPWTPPHGDYHLPEDDPSWLMYKDKPWPVEARVHASFVNMADRQAGQVLDLLEELGIAENTLVFFMSDNGAAMRFDGILDSSGPLQGAKRSMHDGGIRSPLIVSWPGKIKAGSESKHITYSADFMPTIAELIGAESAVPSDINGISILPTLLGKSKKQKEHDCLYWEWPGRKGGKMPQAVRYNKWKLVRMDSNDPWQLYSIYDDIFESEDLASKHPDVVAHVNDWLKNNTTPFKK